MRTEDGGDTWKDVSVNLREWLHAVAFADAGRGYIVGERGIILRTDDGGKTWKDSETNVKTNLFAIAIASRDDALIAGDQGVVLATSDGGANWQKQPTLTSSTLFAVAYRGGPNAWIAGRGSFQRQPTHAAGQHTTFGHAVAQRLKGAERASELLAHA